MQYFSLIFHLCFKTNVPDTSQNSIRAYETYDANQEIRVESCSVVLLLRPIFLVEQGSAGSGQDWFRCRVVLVKWCRTRPIRSGTSL